MKRILPILAAFALTAMTASAMDYYYEDAVYGAPVAGTEQDTWGNNTNIETQVIDYGEYQIVRTSYWWRNTFSQGANDDSRFKIRVTGDNVDLYIAEWMDTATDVNQVDALTKKNITDYGYYYVDGREHAVDHETWNMPTEVLPDPDRYVVLERFPVGDGKETLRHGYYLGNFSAGDEIEIYMKDSEGGEIRSNSTLYWGGRYDYDNYDQVVAARLRADEAYQGLSDEEIQAAARKVMPLAKLEPTNGHSVFFAIYAGAPESVVPITPPIPVETVGSPLPGGFPIALVAGVFALGFWYVRRRKAIAA